MTAFAIDTFKRSPQGIYVPFVRDEDRRLQQVAAAAMPGPQYAFLCAPEREVGLAGSRGGGKTSIMIHDFLGGIGRGFGTQYKGILLRRSQREFTDVLSWLVPLVKSIWPRAQFNRLKNIFEWPSGETLELSYYDNEADWPLYQGKSYAVIMWEELTLWESPKPYLSMFSCLRSVVAADAMPRKIRFTCNPSGPGHSWVKHRFQLSGIPTGCGPCITEVGENGEPSSRRVIHVSFYDNSLLKRTEPQYMRDVEISCEGDSARKAAWTKGDWDVVSGGFFDEIFYKYGNTIRESEFDIPEGGHCFFAYDHGGSSPACFLYAWENTDGCDIRFKDGKVRSGRRGDIHLLGELYFSTGKANEGLNLPIAEMLRAHIEYKIRRGWRWRDPISGKWSDIMRRGCADTQIWDDSNERGSVAEEFENPVMIDGIKCPGIRFERANKGPNSIAIGGALMRERFVATAPRAGERTRSGKGLFVVENQCPEFLRTVPVLTRDKRHPDKYADGTENHLADCCRYLLNHDLTPAFSTHRRQYF